MHSCSHSPQRASEFCKNSARSLVALYHEGALPCECHPAGAIGHPCSPEGGQCPCRPHVIGRQCTRCQTGFYGFPHCKRKCTFRAAKVISGPGGWSPPRAGPVQFHCAGDSPGDLVRVQILSQEAWAGV